MPNLRTTNCIVSVCFTVLFAATGITPATAQNSQGSQRLVLVDPTPRERDPHAVFADDPVQRRREKLAADLQRTERRKQIAADTDQLLVLAQQLRNSVVNHDTSVPASDVMTAQKIEKLAKSVKDTMKQQ
jgi:hypothetical protein